MTLEEQLRRGETRPALETTKRLDREIHEGRIDAEALEGTRAAFLALLDLRGYLLRTPEELAGSIREIRELGPGFDLYDLAAGLASCDAAASQCRGPALPRRIPELSGFAPSCSCRAASVRPR